jgi:hypothetical protein
MHTCKFSIIAIAASRGRWTGFSTITGLKNQKGREKTIRCKLCVDSGKSSFKCMLTAFLWTEAKVCVSIIHILNEMQQHDWFTHIGHSQHLFSYVHSGVRSPTMPLVPCRNSNYVLIAMGFPIIYSVSDSTQIQADNFRMTDHQREQLYDAW